MIFFTTLSYQLWMAKTYWEELLQSVSDLFSANTTDTDPGVSRDQKFYEKFKNTHCQVDHSAKIE